MSEQFNYRSIFAPHFDNFLKLKHDRGYTSLRAKWILLEFDNFFKSMDIKELYITKELIEQWRNTRINDGPTTIYSKYCVWSQFCKYMCHAGYECYIPRTQGQVAKSRFSPYIYTHKQIRDIFQASDSLDLYDRNMSTSLFVIPTIIRVLYATGMRVSEALSLKNKDVDFNNSCITLLKTKNGEQRLAPITDSLQKILEQYVQNRGKLPIANTSDPKGYFFISPNGSFCRAGSIYCWFRKILTKSGIPYIGNHSGPRVHDLRHTFAVHSMEKLVKSGYDLYYTLPLLSTYLGHKSISSTEQYVRLTQEVYPEILDDERKLCSYIFPKIKIDCNEND